MFCVHGTWVPYLAEGFVRQGEFYLWVESNQSPAAVPAPRRGRQRASILHPRHVGGEALVAFLTERLGILPSGPGSRVPTLHPLSLLPSAGRRSTSLT